MIFGNNGDNITSFKYLRHNSLLLVSNAMKSRLILSFIFANTPEKINKEDYEKLNNLYFNNVKAPQMLFTGLSVLTSLSLLYKKRFNLTHWFPYVKYIALPIFINTHFYYGIENLFASKFVKSDLVGELALKYNFGIFDFNQSKKDSSIKTFINMTELEGRKLLSFNSD